MADIFVSELGRMAVMFYVILILRLALDVHISRVPVPLFGHALRTRVRPDSEFRITRPVRATIGLQRLPKWQERAVRNLAPKEGRVSCCPGYPRQCKRTCAT